MPQMDKQKSILFPNIAQGDQHLLHGRKQGKRTPFLFGSSFECMFEQQRDPQTPSGITLYLSEAALRPNLPSIMTLSPPSVHPSHSKRFSSYTSSLDNPLAQILMDASSLAIFSLLKITYISPAKEWNLVICSLCWIKAMLPSVSIVAPSVLTALSHCRALWMGPL